MRKTTVFVFGLLFVIVFSSTASAIIDYVDSPTPSDTETGISYADNVSTCVDITVPGQSCTADMYFYENSSGSWVEYGQSWYDRDWNYRKSFTINHTFVDGSLSGFPFLVDLVEDSDLVTYAQADFDDVVFVDSDNNLLPFEFDCFNASTGNLTAWVNISSVSGSVDTVFYMYYGNPSVSSMANPAGTWDSNFVGVWHMNKDNATHTWDSTSNDNDGEFVGTVTETSGVVGNSLYLSDIPEIHIPNDASLEITDEIFMEGFLTHRKDTESFSYFWDIQNNGPLSGWYCFYRWDSNFLQASYYNDSGDNGYMRDYPGLTVNHTYYTIFDWKADGYTHFYLDGVVTDNESSDFSTIGWGAHPDFKLRGNYVDYDELRMSKTIRSSAWVNLTFDTCNQTTGLLTTGKQEIDDGTVTDTYCADFSVNCGTTYYWSVNTIFNCSGSIWWENHTYSFTTSDCPVSHINPVNNSCCNCPCCISICAKMSNLTSDTIKFAFQSNYTGIWSSLEDERIAPANATYCLCVPEFVWYNYTYYWRVVYNVGDGAEYSDIYSFTTEESIDDCPCGETGNTGSMVEYFDYGILGLIGILGLLSVLFIVDKRRK